MPLVEIKLNKKLEISEKEELKEEIQKDISLINKTPNWLMINIIDSVDLNFNSSNDPACMIEVKTYGKVIYNNANRLSSALTKYISAKFDIDQERIYVAYFDTDTWSYAGENF